MPKDDSGIMKKLAEKYSSRNLNIECQEKFIKSGSAVLDTVTSNGKGIPLNKFIQISFESGLAKTTLILHVCKHAIMQGYKVAYLDIKGGVNKSLLDGIGLSEYLGKSFFLFTASTFEDAEEILDAILELPNLVYVVIDSVTALLPSKLTDKSIAEAELGLRGRYAGAFLTKYRVKIIRSVCRPTVFFTNQIRNKLNFKSMASNVATEDIACKFYCDIRLYMRSSKKIEKALETVKGKDSVQFVYENVIWTDKNKYNTPFLQGVLYLEYGKGVFDSYFI